MKTMFRVRLSITLVILLLFGCGQKSEGETNQEEAAIEEIEESSSYEGFVSRPISKGDSIFFESQLLALSGIEKYAVGDSYYMLSSLLGFKGEETAYERSKKALEQLDEYPAFYEIQALDSKNGYIKYSPLGAEVTYTKVYWNLKDGSKLIAVESWGCGPICESEISFSKHKDGVFQQLNVHDIIPEINDLPPMIDERGDPVEYQFVLPRQGKDIKYCLAQDCITLKWSDGTFKIAP